MKSPNINHLEEGNESTLFSRGFAKLCIGLDAVLSVLPGRFSTYRNKPKFKKTFYATESLELIGKKLGPFIIVTFLFLLTILSIGFAKDSLRFLKKQMADPFVSSVTADIPNLALLAGSNMEYMKFRDEDSLKEQFHYKNIDEFSYFSEYFNDAPKKSGRTVGADDTLVSAILNYKDNQTIGHSFTEYQYPNLPKSQNYSLIVTYEFFQEVLGQDIEKDPPFIYHANSNQPIPISAVVRQLPNNCDFISTHYFFDNIYYVYQECFPFEDSTKRIFIMLDIDPVHSDTIDHYFLSALQGLFERNDQPFDKLVIDTLVRGSDQFTSAYHSSRFELAYRPTTLIQLDFSEPIPPYQQNGIFEELKRNPEINKLFTTFNKDGKCLFKYYSPELLCNTQPKDRSGITINFRDLDYIKDFGRVFKARTDIELQLEKVQSLENYNFVTIMTNTIAYILIFFSFLSINIYIANLVYNHLNKIKTNLGTFKAFGIEIKFFYNIMVFVFIFTSEIFALIVGGLFGYLGGIKWILKVVANFKIEDGFKFFYIHGVDTLLLLLAMLFLSFLTSYIVINHIFSFSPGDLVYNRTHIRKKR
jgi:hypothetical protein